MMEQYPILKEFQDVFLEELLRIAPNRKFDFSIDLILGEEPISHVRYHMTTIAFKNVAQGTIR